MSNPPASSSSPSTESIPEASLASVLGFIKLLGISDTIPSDFDAKHLLSDIVGGLLKPVLVERGRVSCIFSVHPSVTNTYGGMQGGAVSSIAQTVSMACARTVVSEDKELFLGEFSISYLSAAPCDADIRVDASITRSGRNLTVVAAEFKIKDSGKHTYTTRATFYNMPISCL